MSLPLPANEAKRLEALRRYRILDTAAEQPFDDFARLASSICEAPIATVTLIDSNRQWFKARVGLEGKETPREHAFCAHTILGQTTMIVEDASTDERFLANPLVVSSPHIRFYAGAPLIDFEGNGLGTLCVIDREPRKLRPEQVQSLEMLARRVMTQIELRNVSTDLAEALEQIKVLHGLLPICAHCKDIRDDKGYWHGVEQYFITHADVDFSHGVCPSCLERHYPEVHAKIMAKKSAAT
jgi:GAF domain-containing protein